MRSMAISGRTEDRDRPDEDGILVLILSMVEWCRHGFCLDHISFRRYSIFHLIYHVP
jgi:hypothetical protein